MIILKQIRFENFLSHSLTNISFEPNQKLLIDGVSGSGKSSIVEALVWVLYGKGRSDNKSLIKKGTTKASVFVVLKDDVTDKHYIIERSINSKNKHEFSVKESDSEDGELKPVQVTGVKGTQEFLETEILKCSYLLFINSVVYLQDNVESFVKQTAAKRKDIILEIIKAADFDEYLKRTKELLQTKKTSFEVLASNYTRLNDSIINDEQITANLSKFEKQDNLLKLELQKINKELENFSTELNLLSIDRMRLVENQRILSEIVTSLSLIQNKIDALNRKIIDLEKIDIASLKLKVVELNSKKAELNELNVKRQEFFNWSDKINKLMRELPSDFDYDREIAKINKDMVELMMEPIEQCPKCGTTYPKMEERRQIRLKTLEDELKFKQQAQSDLYDLKNAHAVKIEALGTVPAVEMSAIMSLEKEITILQPFERQLVEAEGKQQIVQDTIKNITDLDLEIKKLTERRDVILQEPSDINLINEKINQVTIFIGNKNRDKEMTNSEFLDNFSNLTLAKDAMCRVEKNKKEVEKLGTDNTKLKEDIESLELLKEAFGTNGVKAIVIDYVIPQLEDKINNILSKLSDFRIKLDTQKSGVGKDTVLEGLFIEVINGQGEQLQFENYSGGERIKIIAAISEALAEIQRIGFRVLDEMFIGLDSDSIEGFTKVMLELQERFSQMICISHLREIKDIFENRIVIVKTNGNSTIQK